MTTKEKEQIREILDDMRDTQEILQDRVANGQTKYPQLINLFRNYHENFSKLEKLIEDNH